MTRFGLSAGFPSAARLCCQRRLRARPPSIAASLEPVVEQPVACSASGACQRLLSMFTQRISSSAVCGYSSLSIMFLSTHSIISCCACGSIQVVTKVARLRRALPSSISSSWTIWYATSGATPSSGSSCRGMLLPSISKMGGSERSRLGLSGPFGCFSAMPSRPFWLGCNTPRSYSPREAAPALVRAKQAAADLRVRRRFLGQSQDQTMLLNPSP